MKKISLLGACVVGALQAMSSANAAPLDALLSANKPSTPGAVEIEAGYDVVNSSVDIFNVRDKDSDFSGTNVGDYHGQHVRAGVAVTPDLWIDGALWKRRIDYRQDLARIDSWQIAAQYKLFEASGYRPTTAIRFGAWGNSADALEKSSPSRFQGITLNSVNVADPKDRQLQLDLIATWPVAKSFDLTAFAGVGRSKVEIGAVNGSVTQNGCNYNLAFGPTDAVGTLAGPCGGFAPTRFNVPNSVSGVNVFEEAEYKANYAHVGFSGKWTSGPWRLTAGYQYQTLDRKDVDDAIERRGGSAVKSNHIVVGEIAYQLTRNMSLFGRGQYMSNQFTGEIPFAYNSLTANRFDKEYGFVSAGVMFNF